MSSDNTKEDIKIDDELSELLDSALKDFDKTLPKTESTSNNESKSKEVAKPNTVLDEEFDKMSEKVLREIADHFDTNFENMMGIGGASSEEQIREGFKQMTAAAQSFLNENGEPNIDLAATINKAVQELNQADPNLMGSQLGPGGDNNCDMFMPVMQDMMQKFLSKEVLYPSLKDILERFPAWLEENKGKLSAEDQTKYHKQQEIMMEVCDVLEKESSTDSQETKKKRFEVVLDLMQKLQDYGQPPSELVGDVNAPPPELEQCSIM